MMVAGGGRMSRTRAFLDNLTHEQLVDRLSLALDGANLGIWDWDLLDDSVQFDRRWCEMLGLDHESTPMVLSTWSDRVHPDDLAQCYRDIREHLEGRAPHYENVHRMRHANGQWLYILDRGRISGRDESGRPVRFTGTHLDITQAELDKRRIARHEQELAELVARLPSAVALFDAELCYVAASAEWIREHGLEGIALRGRSHYELRPDTSERWRQIHARTLRGEVLRDDEERFTSEDGSERWFRWSARPWERAGGIAGILVSFEDVTSSVLQRQAREREQAARLASLAIFAGGVAHEINTPLQVITLEAAVLERALPPGNDALRQSIRSIAETAGRASAITRALRTLARDARHDPEEPVLVRELFANVESLCRTRFSTSSVELSFVDGTGEGSISGRPAELLHMLLNLVDNALHAARERERWVRVEAHVLDDRIVLRCMDGGPGIAGEHVDQLGSPFFTTKAPGQGTGLGLGIVRSLAERGRGELVYVRDAPATTFELRLPRHEARSDER
jgi:PAS domain S-box-containing protein